jgi:ADP-ribose pyrophosphatase YjhB (NUDIX family)
MSCNNCGKRGHTFYQCKMPIISNGIIAYRKHPETRAIEYLMIRRRNTLGLMDFIRGKYSVYNKYYIMNMISQMTVEEMNMLLTHSFDEICAKVWDKHADKPFDKPADKPLDKPPGLFIDQRRIDAAEFAKKTLCFSSADSHSLGSNKWSQCDSSDNRYKSEEVISRDKFNQLKRGIYYDNSKKGKTNGQSTNNMFTQSDQPITPSYSLESIIHECQQSWYEPEWGFPKGKRNYNESDIDCAVREFYEETGFKSRNMIFIVNNIAPYEEIFMGSNYKSYKHRYFLMYVDYNTSLTEKMTDTDKLEISKVEWKSFNDCLSAIRPYNLEKKRILSNVNIVLSNCTSTLA